MGFVGDRTVVRLGCYNDAAVTSPSIAIRKTEKVRETRSGSRLELLLWRRRFPGEEGGEGKHIPQRGRIGAPGKRKKDNRKRRNSIWRRPGSGAGSCLAALFKISKKRGRKRER